MSHRKSRLGVARQMYQMRFPGEDVSRATMQQLRGMEGSRVRRAYRQLAVDHGIEWHGRRYDPTDSSASDLVNRALSVANSVLYGVVHTVIVAVGCSPGLGFVHTGQALSFVYDLADLYKVETSFPAAFEAAAQGDKGFQRTTRRMVRERVHDVRLLERAVEDVHLLLLGAGEHGDDEESRLSLFDEQVGEVPAGTDYAVDR